MRYHLTFCILKLFLASETLAYPNGAGGCMSGIPAVGGNHLEINQKSVIPGYLDQSGVSFSIGGRQLSKEAINIFPTGEDLLVEASSPGVPIKGILVRIERRDSVDSTAALVPGENTKLADDVCSPPATGITHLSSENKSTVKGTIRFDEAIESIICEVTVVFANNATLSSFAYDKFDLQFEGSASTAEPLSAVPVDPTTLQPTLVDTEATASPTTIVVSTVPTNPTTFEPTMFDTEATTGSVYPTTTYPTSEMTVNPTNTADKNTSLSESKPLTGDSTKSSGAKGSRKNKVPKNVSKGSTSSATTKSPKSSMKKAQQTEKSSHKKIEKSTEAPKSASKDDDDEAGSRRQLLRRI
jgi:hypothetical protein